MDLRRLHRINAVALVAFAALHLGNHLSAALSPDAHLAVMERLRLLYRFPPLETVLLALFATQIGLGGALVWRRGRPHGGWAWAQVVSGLYLAFFLVQHLVAVIGTRIAYADIDTNVWWAASVVSRPPFSWYFAPYYVFGVVALFTHLAAALRFRRWPAPAGPVVALLPVAGGALGVTIVAALAGAFGPVDLPPAYTAYLDAYWFD